MVGFYDQAGINSLAKNELLNETQVEIAASPLSGLRGHGRGLVFFGNIVFGLPLKK
jgi:hypothetical protein